MKCKFCNGNEFKKVGFKNYNRRYECMNCQSSFIPLFERIFGNFIGKNKWEKFNDLYGIKDE